MSSLSSYIPLFINGAVCTLASWVCAGFISLCIGTFLGISSCAHLGSRPVMWCVRLYTFITKGIPAYVHILIFYFVIPGFFKIPLSGFSAATAALAFCSSGYVTEIIRSTMNAIPRGQWDACQVLGYNTMHTVKRIIFPQALSIALPALIGELEQLLKSTSLLATIGVTEITRVGMNIISRELNPLPIYLIIACMYLFLSGVLTFVATYIERKRRRGYY